MLRAACDIHTHTLYSRHAYSTIQENVLAAAEQGMELVGITDHYWSLRSVPHQPDLKDYEFFMNYRTLPREWHGVTLLRGCEADIVDTQGNLFGHDVEIEFRISGSAYRRPRPLKDILFPRFDYVIASIHNIDLAHNTSQVEATRMYVNALQDPKVIAVGHIGCTGAKIDRDEVIVCARDLGKCIELNEASLHGEKRAGSVAPCREIAIRCAELGCPVTFGSDAHVSCDVGRFNRVLAMLDEIHFPEELCVCRSKEAFLAQLERAVGPLE